MSLVGGGGGHFTHLTRLTSVAYPDPNPDPDPRYPYVFGPPASGIKPPFNPHFNSTLKLALTPVQDLWIRLRSVLIYLGRPKSRQRVAIADFWPTSHHDGKISPGLWGWVGGARPPPFTLLLSRTKFLCMLQLRGQIHYYHYFISIPNVYSLGRTETIPVCAPHSMVALHVLYIQIREKIFWNPIFFSLFSVSLYFSAGRKILLFFTHLISQRAPHTN